MTAPPLTLARTAVVEGLRALRHPLIGDRVFRDRTRSWGEGEPLGIAVYTPRQRTTVESADSARIYLATADLSLEIVARASEDAFDQVDVVRAAVEQFMALNERLGDSVRRSTYLGFDSTFDRRGEVDLVVCQVRFELEYQLELPEYRPTADLEEIAVEVRIGGEGSPVETLLLLIDQTEAP